MSKVAALVVACLALRLPRHTVCGRKLTLLTTSNVTAGKPTEFHFTFSRTWASRGIIVFKVTNEGQDPA